MYGIAIVYYMFDPGLVVGEVKNKRVPLLSLATHESPHK